MVESTDFMCQTYYTTCMMICEMLRVNFGRHSVGGIAGCVMGLMMVKLEGTKKIRSYLDSLL